MNRDPDFLDELIDQGEDRATDFVAALGFEQAWRAGDADAVIGFFAEDAEVSSAAPFTVRETRRRGPAGVREFVADALGRNDHGST